MTVNVTGTVRRPDGSVYASASITFVPAPSAVRSNGGDVVPPLVTTVTANGSGAVDFDILPGNYTATETATGRKFSVAIPDQPASDLADLIDAAAIVAYPDAVATAQAARDAAAASSTSAAASATAADASETAAADSATFADQARIAAQAAQNADVAYVDTPGFNFIDQSGFSLGSLRTDGIRGLGVSLLQGAVDASDFQISWDDGHDGLRLTDAAGFSIDLLSQSGSGSGGTTIIYGDTPSISDGHNLFLWRSKLAALREGTATQAKLLLLGDSWFERGSIPARIAGQLYGIFGRGADGWISLNSTIAGRQINGWVLSHSGWTVADATDGGALPLAIDGFRLDATGTSATLGLTGVWGTTINLYYRNTTGVFRYRVNGGSWNTVTGAGTNAIAKVSVTGLAASAGHSLDIDLTGNAGTVTLYGVYATGMTGIEVSKAGNSSAIATDHSAHIGQAESQFILTDMAPDCTAICLGNNDRSGLVSIATYKAALTTIISGISTKSASCGYLMLCTPRNGRSGSLPVEDYAAAMIALAGEGRLVDWVDYTIQFGPYAEMNTLGAWDDPAHLSDLGARMFASIATPILSEGF